MLNFNVAPYFNDFKDEQNFYKTLFVPTRPVQTRELNQIQSVLQNQIKSHADHIFKNGSMVIPGHVYYDSKVYSIKLLKLYNDISTDLIVDNLVGSTLVGTDTGVTALVVHYDLSTNVDESVIYVKFMSSSTSDDAVKQFKNSEVIFDQANAATKLKLVSSNAINNASIVSVNEGIYYVNGYFVRVAKQTITLEKFNNTPTWRAGLELRESVVTAVEDSTLYDNALGYSNYAAPGADRYKLELVLGKRSFDYDDLETVDADGNTLEEKFIDLIQVKEGQLIKEVNSTAYSEIEKIFARRTYDESGDYEVVPFQVLAKDYRTNVRGDWASGITYLEGDYVKANSVWWEALNDGISGATTPNTTVGYKMSDGGVNWVMVESIISNKGVYQSASTDSLKTQQAAADQIVYQVKPGKAYVRGFEVETQAEKFVVGSKALDFEHVNDEIIPIQAGTYTDITNVRGLPNSSTYEEVDLYSYTRAEITSYATDKVTATADATATTTVNSIAITLAGYGYDHLNPPAVVLTSGGGNGAVAVAVVAVTGEIQEIKVLNGGSGYTSNPTVTIDPPPASPVKIGTCRIRSMEYNSGTIGSTAATYRCQIFDVDLSPDYNWGLHVKSLIGQGASGFESDVAEEIIRIPGLINVDGSPSPTQQITGVGTSFLDYVRGGQYIIIGGTVRRKAAWLTSSNNVLYVTSPINVDLASQTVDVVYSTFYNITANLIVPLTKRFVRNIRGEDDVAINTTYSVRRHIDNQTPTTGTINITLTVDNETFAPLNVGNYIVSNKTTGDIVTAPQLSLDSGATTLTISGLESNTHEVIVTVEKTSTAAREKSKTRAVTIMDVRTQKDLEKAIIKLNEADVYRIVRVLKADGAGTLSGSDYGTWAAESVNGSSDITKYFILDNGQTPFYYDIASLSKTRNCPKLDNTIRIVFEYFNHSAGDFFTTNSYIDVARDKIDPVLRDSIDFRPRISDDGVNFSNSGSSITEPAALNSHFKVDYSYFLPRKDIITIDSGSNLGIIEGESSYSVREPAAKTGSMIIATATLSPGSFNVNNESITITKKDHKRYTMADIGKLDRRIGNLEYYTQLSLLEKNVIDKNVTDQNGYDRFKAGVLVDDFNNQAVSDASHPDFLCALDMESGECRAFVDTTSIEMSELALSETQRSASHYKMTGDILTLPYTNVVSVEQPIASRTEFVNPFAVVTFAGQVQLYPSQDTWFEDRRAPNIIIDQEGNYNSIKVIAEQTGVLGTKWNAWQTTWTGASTSSRSTQTNVWWWGVGRTGATIASSSQANVPFNGSLTSLQGTIQAQATNTSNSLGWGNWNTTTVTATVNGVQTRTGTGNVLKERIDTQVIDDRIIDTTMAPIMRTRPVIFKAVGLRPNTKMNPFFDGVDVSQYINELPEVVVDGAITGTFKRFEDGVADDEDNNSRRIGASEFTLGGSTDVSFKSGAFYDRGDVVKVFDGSTDTGATAIVVDVLNQTTNGSAETVIRLVGEKSSGTFNWGSLPTSFVGYSLRSSVGNASANVSTIREPGLTSNSAGEVVGVFVIPNNATHKFETGTRLFKLTDDKTNNDFVATTKGSALYTATGIVQVRQSTIANIRNAEIVNEQITESQNVTTTLSASANLFPPPPSDPLAQTFTISELGGAFITQAEVYFAVADPDLPVRCEIRDVVNGYPGKRVLAVKTLRASEVTVNANALTPTVFTFPRPTYLIPGVEYCVVLLSDSSVYKVWIARMGEQIIGSSQIITSQPSLGSLFKSQNNSTWTAEQFEDLAFKLYKAKFDISKAADVLFVNKRLPTVMLTNDPIQSVVGTNRVRVYHPNHGFVDGDTVELNGIYVGPTGPFSTLATTYIAGDNVTDTKSYIISNVEYDFYTIDIVDSLGAAVNATYSSTFGKSAVESTYQLQYSTMSPNIQMQVFPATAATVALRPMKGDEVNAYNFVDEFFALNRENVHFTSPMMVASHDNEAKRLAKAKSMRVRVTMTSVDENLSPVLDTERASMVLVRNKINAPTLVNLNDTTFDDISLFATKTVTFRAATSESDSFFDTTDSTIFDDIDKLTPGKSVSVTAGINIGLTFEVLGKVRISVGGTPTARVYINTGSTALVEGTDTTACSMTLHNRYVSEIAPYNTSVLSTYVAQPMRLAVPSTGARLTIDANIPTETMVSVYYRAISVSDITPFHETSWKEMPVVGTISTTADFQSFTEYMFEVNNIAAFDLIQTKVVFTSTNTALTPRISNLRLLALA